MHEDLTPEAGTAGDRSTSPAGRKWSVRPGVVIALVIAAALIVFVVQNDSKVPVTWLFIELNGPLWAVIVAAAVAGALLSQVLGWVVRRTRRRRRR